MCKCVCVCPLKKTGLVIKMHYHPTVSREETNSLSLCLLSRHLILILSFIYSLTPSLQGCGEVVEVLVRGLSSLFLFTCTVSYPVSNCVLVPVASTHLLLCPYISLSFSTSLYAFALAHRDDKNVMQNYSEWRRRLLWCGGWHSAVR